MTYSPVSLSNEAQSVLTELRNEFSCKHIYIFSGDKIKKNELSGPCRCYEGEERRSALKVLV